MSATHFFSGQFFGSEFFFGAIPPTPTPSSTGAMGGGVWSGGGKKGKLDEDLESSIRAIFAELTGSAVYREQVAEVLEDAPQAVFKESVGDLEKVEIESIRFDVLALQEEITKELFRLYKLKREDEEIILLLH